MSVIVLSLGFNFHKIPISREKCKTNFKKESQPPKKLDGMTPFESWSGHKPNVTHFRIKFACLISNFVSAIDLSHKGD